MTARLELYFNLLLPLLGQAPIAPIAPAVRGVA